MSSQLGAVAQISDEQYQLVASRRQAFDSLMWQTPVLSLTGLAFLFSIALSRDNSPGARIVSAVLALVTALSSIQLMIKHRNHETSDSVLLESYERERGLIQIHARRKLDDQPWYVRWSSYVVWLFTLWLFAIAAIFVLLNGLCGWKLL